VYKKNVLFFYPLAVKFSEIILTRLYGLLWFIPYSIFFNNLLLRYLKNIYFFYGGVIVMTTLSAVKTRRGLLTTVATSVCIMASALFFNAESAYTVSSRDSIADGLVFTMSNGNLMKVQVCTDKIIRIVYTVKSSIPSATDNYIVVKGTWNTTAWTTGETTDAYSITTNSLRVDVAKATGAVTFYTSAGTQILTETEGKTLSQKTVGTYTAYEGTIKFNGTDDEGLYGFGQFQNGYLNQSGQTLTLNQLNQTDCSPFFMSTRGFGVLWINYSEMTATSAPNPLKLWSNWATNDAIDYYFIYGPAFDSIISAYRTITGPAVMWPKWAYGFWQCKNRYEDQETLLDVVRQYRSKNYPIDNIVQDWMYYPSGGNGCQCFDASRYPDVAGMIKTLHDSLNCHFTISVWPSFNSASGANYNLMNDRGYLLSTNDYLGTTYDAFNDSAAFYYWKFINDSLVSKGVDGFWPDATEPEYHTTWIASETSQGPAVKVENIFPLLHSRTLYNGFRTAHNDKKRVCNLTRSYYAGSQRLGAAYWTGDITSDFSTYTTQIPAGLNVCMTGLPLFCTDVGGFMGTTVEDNVLTRWFEWGAFNPVFRVHGSRSCTEIWCSSGNEAILLNYSKLRYRLFPYIYSMAWKVTNEGYTMMRALPFDFLDDANVRNINDQFMFGPALMICPIATSASATSRSVYLPAGTWYDFWTGTTTTGTSGQTITASAPLETMPVYVRAGSIIPMGPEITYADTAADPIELRVYTGASGSFNIYEDAGDGYDYENGSYAIIPITWDETTQNLTIGARQGSFIGMLESRTFNVVFVSTTGGTGETVSSTISKSIPYIGGAVILNKTSGEIGVLKSFAPTKGMYMKDRIQGHKYIATAFGNESWRVTLTTPAGRLIASKEVKGGTSCIIADRLASGIYFARMTCVNISVKQKTVIIP
jgi:alpha-D-xyloside xylohydrolase